MSAGLFDLDIACGVARLVGTGFNQNSTGPALGNQRVVANEARKFRIVSGCALPVRLSRLGRALCNTIEAVAPGVTGSEEHRKKEDLRDAFSNGFGKSHCLPEQDHGNAHRQRRKQRDAHEFQINLLCHHEALQERE